MRAIFYKGDLKTAVEAADKIISKKTQIPILSGIKITVGEQGGVVEATRVTASIKYNVGCDAMEYGEICAEASTFHNIIKKLPDGEIEIISDNKGISIRGGKAKFIISGYDPSAFPEIQETRDGYVFKLTAAQLSNITKKAIPFAAQTEVKRAVLTGILFDICGGELHAVASDAHRLAYIRDSIDTGGADKKVVIPRESLEKFPQRNDDTDVKVICGERHVTFDYGDYKITTGVIYGEFLDYKRILKINGTTIVTIPRKTIKESLERAIILISEDISVKTENKVPVVLEISKDSVKISCTTGKGSMNDIIETEDTDGELKIGFNCRFLLEAINACNGDIIRMEFTAPTSGCIIRNNDMKDGSVYMVLPVRMYK